MKSRVAIFHEPAFPGAEHFMGQDGSFTGRVPDGFETVDAARLSAGELKGDFDIVFMPFGGYYPLAAEESLLSFTKEAGDIVFLGGGPFSSPCRIENGKWRVHDPLDLGDRWRWSFVSFFTSKLGLSFWDVPDKTGFSSEGFKLELAKDMMEFFDGIETLPCEKFKGSLQPLYSGRKKMLAMAPEGVSSVPSVREFLTLVEPGFKRDVNGRFICAGFLPDETWTEGLFKSFLAGIVNLLEADSRERLEYGLRLSSYAIRGDATLLCEWFGRNGEEAGCPSQLKMKDVSGKDILSLDCLDSGNVRLPIEGLGQGVYTVELFKGARLVDSSAFSILPDRESPNVKVCRRNGYAAFEVDGEAIPAQIYAFNPFDRALDTLVRQFAEADIHIHHFLYPLAFGWREDGNFDWSDFDRLAERVLMNDPHGLLYPRIFLTTPPWWDAANPEELKVFKDGNRFKRNYTIDKNPLNASSKYSALGFNERTSVPSWESEKWRRDAAAALESFVRHTQDGSHRGNMLGYFLSCGTYGEWLPMNIHGGLSWEDLSLPALKSFREAISFYYEGGNAERAKRWKSLLEWKPEDIKIPRTDHVMAYNREHRYADPECNLKAAGEIASPAMELAAPPNFVRRHIARYGVFRDPAQSLDTLEYYRFLRESFAKMVAFFTSAVKRASNGKAVTGVFSGSQMNDFLQDDDGSYHFAAFGELLRDVKDLDVAATPYNYYKRFNTPEADGNMRNVPGSMLLSDKIFISENDQRTMAGGGEYWWMLAGDKTPEESCEALFRNFMICLSHHAGLWWYDFGKGWYDHPLMMKAIADCQRIYGEVLKAPKRNPLSNAPDKLNIIYSPLAYDYVCASSKLCRANTTAMLQEHLNRTGFPWEVYLQDDLARIPKSRAYLFLNTCALTGEERAHIDANMKRNGNVIIWLYAAGLYKDGEISLDNISALTGFKLGWSFEKTIMDVKITDRTHPMTVGLTDEDDKEFTTDYEKGSDLDCISATAPEFFVDDPAARILGVNGSTGRAAFAVKDFGNWKSIYIACPLIPKNVIRKILLGAGLSQTLDTDDALYTNGDVICIRAKEEGVKNISAKEDFALESLRGQETWISQNGNLRLSMKYGETFVGRISKALS